MSRQTRFGWLSHQAAVHRRTTTNQRGACPTRRPPRFELLEDRRLLAITVSTLVDELDGSIVDGDVSLRDAIVAAPVGETINFSVTGAINLSLGQLTINKNLTVTGPGANLLAINAGGASRVLNITGGTVHVSGLTLTGGNADRGGGVRNVGPATTTLTRVVIQGNTATAAIDPVNFDAGGGVWNTGTLTITSSTISGNQATSSGGGGVWTSGALAVTQSTVSGNSAQFEGGGILAHGGTANISHSTITGNSVPGFGKGAGIKSSLSATTISHSIISGNTAFSGSEIYKSYGTVNLAGHNVLGDSSKTWPQALILEASPPGGTNILATSDFPGSAALSEIIAPLADNGGPTRTHAIMVGSPAFQAGDPAIAAPPSFDQRGAGFPRVVGGRIDIGAVELQSVSPLVVNTLVDENDGDYSAGDLSLREALLLADTFAGADTVSFAAGLVGVITLTQGQLAIRSDVMLTGPGANLLSIIGNGANRIFDVNDQSPDPGIVKTVAISGLTLAGGNVPTYHGGAILNGENLTITACTIRDNFTAMSSGGIHNIGGGGSLTVRDSTISGNAAGGNGGGIASYGALTVQNSTISGNRANGSGGGIASFGNAVTIQNCTLTLNRADGNADAQGQGGGLWFADTTVVLHNSIIAGNSAFNVNVIASDVIAHNGGASAASSNNVIGAGGSGGLANGANGNQVGVVNPGLLPLANNGGPTMTHRLLATSPAFNAGNNVQTPGGADQRGGAFARIANGTVDVGAFEIQPVGSLIVGTNVDEDDGNYAPHDLSLREAIALANGISGSDVITFSSFFNAPRTIVLAMGQMGLRSDLTITGPGANLLTISGNNATRVLDVDDLSPLVGSVRNVAISGMSITGGSASNNAGGGILNRENLTITACAILDNRSLNGDGGGIASFGTLTLNDSTISENTASNFGGGIFNSGTLTLYNSTISGNSALLDGGGVRNLSSGVMVIQNSTISGNTAGIQVTAEGGGIANSGSAVIQNSTLSGNTANGGGSGIFQYKGMLTVRSSTITGNVGPSSFWFIETNVLLHNSIVSGNGTVDLFSADGNINSLSSHNLIGSVAPGGLMQAVNGNQIGVNPGLAPLADNGGPTMTHRPLLASRALNAGNNVEAPSGGADQRGGAFARIANGTIDIGAYEIPPVSSVGVVVTNEDEDDGNYAPDDLSLREAIGLAYAFGPDEITFSPSKFGMPNTIALTQGPLEITRDLTIAGPGALLLNIDGSDGRWIFAVNDFSPTARNVEINGLTISGGGGIFNEEVLTISASTIRDNFATDGGGVYNGALGTLTVQNSTVSGNSALYGGGIANYGVLNVQNSTLSGNTAGISGGAIFSRGAVGAFATVTVQNSTITENIAKSGPANQKEGGGIWFVDTTVLLHNSIVSDNYKFNADDTPSDIFASNGAVTAASSHNLIGPGGSGGLANGANGNLIGMANPMLAPLAFNGGPTMTHALLPGSPAIDAGNPAYLPPPDFDQRGAPYVRVTQGRIDIGAYEAQPSAPPSADFDDDLDIDGHDFLRWQRGLGTEAPFAVKSEGDADSDRDVDADDLAVWKAQFGNPALTAAAPAAFAALVADDSPSRLSPQAVDAALAWQMAAEAHAPRPLFRPRWLRAR